MPGSISCASVSYMPHEVDQQSLAARQPTSIESADEPFSTPILNPDGV
jgi:hypothetical protein